MCWIKMNWQKIVLKVDRSHYEINTRLGTIIAWIKWVVFNQGYTYSSYLPHYYNRRKIFFLKLGIFLFAETYTDWGWSTFILLPASILYHVMATSTCLLSHYLQNLTRNSVRFPNIIKMDSIKDSLYLCKTWCAEPRLYIPFPYHHAPQHICYYTFLMEPSFDMSNRLQEPMSVLAPSNLKIKSRRKNGRHENSKTFGIIKNNFSSALSHYTGKLTARKNVLSAKNRS